MSEELKVNIQCNSVTQAIFLCKREAEFKGLTPKYIILSHSIGLRLACERPEIRPTHFYGIPIVYINEKETFCSMGYNTPQIGEMEWKYNDQRDPE